MKTTETAIVRFNQAVAELREQGFAITYFYPAELEESGITARDAESVMVQAVNDAV